MNIQEAIEIIEQSKIKIAKRENVIFKAGEIIRECVQVDYAPLEVVVNVINQIHEPQKAVVPKFVALRIDKYKSSNKSLYQLLDLSDDKEFNDWLLPNREVDASRCDVLARAWLFGYEVEQEKLYTVEIPNPNKIGNEVSVLMMNGFRQVVIKKEYGNDWKKEKGFQLTEKEIKQDFEWAWQFAEEVE